MPRTKQACPRGGPFLDCSAVFFGLAKNVNFRGSSDSFAEGLSIRGSIRLFATQARWCLRPPAGFCRDFQVSARDIGLIVCTRQRVNSASAGSRGVSLGLVDMLPPWWGPLFSSFMTMSTRIEEANNEWDSNFLAWFDATPGLVMQGLEFAHESEGVRHPTTAQTFLCITTPKVPQLALQAFKRLGARLVGEVEPFGDGPAVFLQQDSAYSTPRHCEGMTMSFSATLIYFFHLLPDENCRWGSKYSGQACRFGRIRRNGCGDNCCWKPASPPESGSSSPDFEPESQTFLTNFQWGVLCAARRPGSKFWREAWTKWARHCLGEDFLAWGLAAPFDQLGFGMALLELGWPFEYLPIGWNFPTHLSAIGHGKGKSGLRLHALHYHNKLNAHGQLVPAGVDWVDQYINVANAALTAGRRNDFDNFCSLGLPLSLGT